MRSGGGCVRPVAGLYQTQLLVQSLAELPRIMAEAFEVANAGRPGPVLVDIPKDIQLASGELEPQFTTVDNEATFPQADVEQARQMLEQAKNPCCTSAVVLVWRRQFRRCVNLSR